MNILSVQSAVAIGHVGNASAVFALQRLGAEVWAVDTVQFSNHPGHGAWAGEVTPPALVAALLAGIAAHGVLGRCDGVLSGYLGEAATGEAVLRTVKDARAANPALLYCCDPVIGDTGPGVYVRGGIPAFFRDQAVAAADILTPNLFELGWLTGGPTDTLGAAGQAAALLQTRMRPQGPGIVLVTSVRPASSGGEGIGVMACAREEAWLVSTPVLDLAANGAGDLMAAVFLFHLLRGGAVRGALEAAVSAVHAVLARTVAEGFRELALVAAQADLLAPPVRFAARAVTMSCA